MFYKGMDVSSLPQCLDEGMEVKDFDGSIMYPLALAKKYGVNSIRLRLWNEPENVPESKGYCNLKYTIAMAEQIKAHGMSFMLDFHYSDFWADPGQQNKPKAWAELTGDALAEAVYQFTFETLTTLRERGLLPEIVQIGNEIRSGLLFPDGELPNYKGMVALVNAGIRGAREAAKNTDMKIMIHLDQGGRYLFIKDWFDNAFAHGLEEFDIIGLSYYPFWHGTFMDLKDTMEKLVQDFRKPIIVAETAHAWRKSAHGFIDEAQEKIAGVPATPEGQKRVLDIVTNITASLPEDMGLGIYYWEPLCVPRPGEGGWCENMGVLDEAGNVMDAIRAFEFTRERYTPEKIAKIYEPTAIKMPVGTEPVFPEECSVLYYDGIVRKQPVKWELANVPENWKEVSGSYTFVGKIEDGEAEDTISVTMQVVVADSFAEEENLVMDANWDNGLTAWNLEKSDDLVQALFCPELRDPFPAPPINSLRVEAPMNFKFTISQNLKLQRGGKYRLKAEYRGVDTTNVDVKLFLQTKEKCFEQVIHPTDEDWTEHVLQDIVCRAEEVTFGIRIVSPPIYGYIRGFTLEAVED